MKYKICLVTSSRADFGLLTPLLRALKERNTFDIQLIATGSHLSKKHGYTIEEIETAGFRATAKVDIAVDNTNACGIGQTLARAVSAFTEKLNQLSPDLVVVLGDRYEMLGVASAAMCLKLPIAHLHGGEVTKGAQDDAIRHSITKLSHLHFVCNDIYRDRVIQMGENPQTVFNTGSLGIDNIYNMQKNDGKTLEKLLSIKFSKTNIMVGYHSTTLGNDDFTNIKILLDDLKKLDDATLIFTMPNADLGGKVIETQFQKFCSEHSNAYFFENLGMQNYISCLAQCDFLVGNSSSGILEAPFLGCYTINVGSRQQGRLQAKTIINVTPEPGEIYKQIIDNIAKIEAKGKPAPDHLFGDGKASKKIASRIEDEKYNIEIMKSFHDLNT